MNCDQVFDVLTRGPFPTGAASDSAVERHLTCCVECRRLATALRPAVELFEEAVRPEDSRGLPSYWGEVAEPQSAAYDATFATLEEEISYARRMPRTLASARNPRMLFPARSLDDCDRLLRFLGAVAVGVMLAFTLRGIGEGPTGNGRYFGGGDASLASWQVCSAAMIAGPEQRLHPQNVAVTLAKLDAEKQRCCLDCHHAGGKSTDRPRMNESAATSCVACHESRVDESDAQESMLDSHGKIGKSSDPGV